MHCILYIIYYILYIIYYMLYIIYHISADPGLRQGRGGAWDHRRCGTCLLSNRHPKAISMASYGRPAQAIATRRPDPSLLLGGPACRSPGIRSQQASQGHINGFLWASKLFLGGPACRSPGIRSQQASQGHINGFLWASKLAVCQPLNP